MSKIPFNIKFKSQIESGEYKVVTYSGEPVQIVKWDCKGKYPLLACIFDGDTDDAAFFTHDGKGMGENSDCLSIITPDEELTEFERRLFDWLSSDTEGDFPEDVMKRCVKARASELLAIARKHFNEVDSWDDGYNTGYNDGKAETLKGLPIWKIADRDINSNTIDFAVSYTQNGGDYSDWEEVIVTNRLKEGERYLELSDLEKLPGFKKEEDHE